MGQGEYERRLRMAKKKGEAKITKAAPDLKVWPDGKLRVRYAGPSGGLSIGGMWFPHGEVTRMSPSKVERLPENTWDVLEVIAPARESEEA